MKCNDCGTPNYKSTGSRSDVCDGCMELRGQLMMAVHEKRVDIDEFRQIQRVLSSGNGQGANIIRRVLGLCNTRDMNAQPNDAGFTMTPEFQTTCDGWTRDYIILHKWDEKYLLDLGIIWCWVSRDYENHEVFGAGISGRHGRQLKRKFQTADEAKVAAQKLAEKACKEMMAKLKPTKPSND